MIATDHDIRRMRHNDKRLTALFLNFTCKPQMTSSTGDNQMKTLESALKQTTAPLQEVMIATDDSFASATTTASVAVDLLAPYESVLRQIGRVPTLKSVQFTSPPQGRGILPVPVLVPLLEETTQLESLAIHDMILVGTQEDFDQLAQQVQRLWYLKSFTLDAIQLVTCPAQASHMLLHGSVASSPSESSWKESSSSSTRNTSSATTPSLDSLFLSLSMLPSLQVLTLTAATSNTTNQVQPPAFSPSAFSALFFSSSIVSLNLQRWNYGSSFQSQDQADAYFTSMTSYLQSNKTLQALTIGPLPPMTLRVAKAWASVLQSNGNTKLTHLELVLSGMLSNDCATTIARSLHGRPSLQSLVLSGRRLGRVSKSTQRAFTDMMQRNYSLHKVFLFRKNFLQPTLEFYTRLNALGRHSLLRFAENGRAHNPEGVWMQALAHPLVHQDLDSIFYFLSSNPSLCVQAAAKSSSEEEGKLRRKRKDDEPKPESAPSSSLSARRRQSRRRRQRRS